MGSLLRDSDKGGGTQGRLDRRNEFVGVWTNDLVGQTFSADSPVFHLLGLKAGHGEAVSMTDFLGRVQNEDRDWVAARQSEVALNPFTALEYRVVSGDGSLRWVMQRGVYEADAKGRLARGRGIFLDVTQFKTADAEIRTAPDRDADPLDDVVTHAIRALLAAQQVGDARIVDLLKAVLMAAGRRIAANLMENTDSDLH